MKVWALTDGEVREGKYLVVRRDGTIPSWGHFVLANVDPCAGAALRAYAAAAREHGYEDDFCASVDQLAEQYDAIAAAHAVAAKIGMVKGADPDKGPHRTDNPAVIDMMRGRGDLTEYRGWNALPDALAREYALKNKVAAAEKRQAELDGENAELRDYALDLELQLAHLRGRQAEIEAAKPPEMVPAQRNLQFEEPGVRGRLTLDSTFSPFDQRERSRRWYHRSAR